MGVIPVRALSSIEPDGIGRVANDDPVEFWVLRNGIGDSTRSRRLAFLAEPF